MDNQRSSALVRGGRGPVSGRGPEPYPWATPGDDLPGSSDWQRYLAAVVRHKWLVLLVTAIGTAAGFAAARTLAPIYAARSILWIDNGQRDGDGGGIAGQQFVEAEGWIEIVTSNAVLDHVVRRLRLYVTVPASGDRSALSGFALRGEPRPGRYRVTVGPGGRTFELSEVGGPVLQRGAVGDSIGRALGFAWAPSADILTPGRPIEFSVTSPYEASRSLAEALDVDIDPGGSFLRLALEGTSPSRTAATLNAIAGRVAAVAAELKRRKLEELAAILGEQQEHARRSVREAEAALAAFGARTADVLHARTPALATHRDVRGDPGLATAFDLRVTLEELRRERERIEQALAAGEGASTLEALQVVEAVQDFPALRVALEEVTQKRAELRALRYRYTEESAPVRDRRAELDLLEQRTVPGLARQLISELARREADLRQRVDSAFRQLRQVPPLAVEGARLERDVAGAEELHSRVRQRHDAARLALVSSLPDIHVLDPAAVPRRPATNRGPLLIAVAFLTSLGLAVVGVTVKDRVDPTLHHPEQVTQGMGLSILGAVPYVGARSSRGGGFAELEVIEALRGVRLRILHARGGDGPLLLTVTSPGAGDGKSFVAANLALSFAHAGYKTLLIDGDVRRGTQHGVVGTPLQPGLTDVLGRRASLERAIRMTTYSGLWFLSSGTRMHRGPELLMSPHLPQLVARLHDRYAVVIVDSPPLAAGADPLILGTATGNALLVLRSGTTDLMLTASKLEALDALPITMLGVVLNDVRAGGAFRYYRYDLNGYSLPEPDRPALIGGGR